MHLFFVVTNKCPDNRHLLLSVSSVKIGHFHDSTCVIGIGEHAFVTTESLIFYSKPQLLHHDNLAKCVAG
jgi:hypothetical protein